MIYLKTYEGIFDIFKSKSDNFFTEEELKFVKDYFYIPGLTDNDRNGWIIVTDQQVVYHKKGSTVSSPRMKKARISKIEIFFGGIDRGGIFNTNYHTIIKKDKIYFVNSYPFFNDSDPDQFVNKIYSDFKNIKESCEHIDKKLFVSKLAYALDDRYVFRNKNQPKKIADFWILVSDYIEDYSINRNGKINRFRLEEMLEDIRDTEPSMRSNINNIDLIIKILSNYKIVVI